MGLVNRMIREINSLLANNVAKRLFDELYPRLMFTMKTMLPGANKIILKDIKVNKTYTNENDESVVELDVEYYGTKDYTTFLDVLEQFNDTSKINDWDLSLIMKRLPPGVKFIFIPKHLGDLPYTRYETQDSEFNLDSLRANLIKYAESGILNEYSTMLNWLTWPRRYGPYQFYHASSNMAAGIVNIKHPIKNRLSTSANNINYTNLVMDNADQWKGFPKRRASLMFSNSASTAHGYGRYLYYILPKDGAKIGVCPVSDLWNAFVLNFDVRGTDEYLFNLFYYNKLIRLLSLEYLQRNANFEDYDKFIIDLKYIDYKIKRTDLEELIDMINSSAVISDNYDKVKMKTMITIFKESEFGRSNVDGLLTLSNKLITPKFEANGHSFLKTTTDKLYRNSLDRDYSTNVEMWTDEPCLIIYNNSMKDDYDLTEELQKIMVEIGWA